MYANLGPGMQLSPMPPSNGPTLMYSDQYVANRMRQDKIYMRIATTIQSIWLIRVEKFR